mmetsp:Transcript_6804/g.14551  ORF Transcript_6804/g.14551 Transcript_6804/m.14551 type:complete len:334 (-) Transcript_6804:49-1050(-)
MRCRGETQERGVDLLPLAVAAAVGLAALGGRLLRALRVLRRGAEAVLGEALGETADSLVIVAVGLQVHLRLGLARLRHEEADHRLLELEPALAQLLLEPSASGAARLLALDLRGASAADPPRRGRLGRSRLGRRDRHVVLARHLDRPQRALPEARALLLDGRRLHDHLLLRRAAQGRELHGRVELQPLLRLLLLHLLPPESEELVALRLARLLGGALLPALSPLLLLAGGTRLSGRRRPALGEAVQEAGTGACRARVVRRRAHRRVQRAVRGRAAGVVSEGRRLKTAGPATGGRCAGARQLVASARRRWAVSSAALLVGVVRRGGVLHAQHGL